MRRDAQQRRVALIKAAAECFADYGYLVPLEKIAYKAGIGRGTLYRNFRDRLALAVAVFQREMDESFLAATHEPDAERAVRVIVERGAKASALYNRLATDIQRERDVADLKKLHKQAIVRWRPIIELAQAAGTLHEQVTAEQMIMATRMIGGLLSPQQSPQQSRRYIDKSLEMLMVALRGSTAKPRSDGRKRSPD